MPGRNPLTRAKNASARRQSAIPNSAAQQMQRDLLGPSHEPCRHPCDASLAREASKARVTGTASPLIAAAQRCPQCRERVAILVGQVKFPQSF